MKSVAEHVLNSQGNNRHHQNVSDDWHPPSPVNRSVLDRQKHAHCHSQSVRLSVRQSLSRLVSQPASVSPSVSQSVRKSHHHHVSPEAFQNSRRKACRPCGEFREVASAASTASAVGFSAARRRSSTRYATLTSITSEEEEQSRPPSHERPCKPEREKCTTHAGASLCCSVCVCVCVCVCQFVCACARVCLCVYALLTGCADNLGICDTAARHLFCRSMSAAHLASSRP
jgi:hypothetical protein